MYCQSCPVLRADKMPFYEADPTVFYPRVSGCQLVSPQLLPPPFNSVDKNMEKRPFLSTKPHLRNSCAESFVLKLET
ncbi:hypothetical protein Y032_0541g3172 [Ancylostoma ceylanicum]|uniref:Uncharacterized protein n=1 Tax=Ancylostoma ceylanicum TaxID=53326 RepID=A0A016WR45_9BILA|nr:hypothetical protein Y032_0541g3172 [Ancylostoma ceylanicum]